MTFLEKSQPTEREENPDRLREIINIKNTMIQQLEDDLRVARERMRNYDHLTIDKLSNELSTAVVAAERLREAFDKTTKERDEARAELRKLDCEVISIRFLARVLSKSRVGDRRTTLRERIKAGWHVVRWLGKEGA